MTSPSVINPPAQSEGSRKLSLLVVTGSYAPDRTGMAPLNTEMCEYLAARGHRVTVGTCFPHYPEWRIPDSYRGRLWTRETRRGVTIHRRWIWVPSQRAPLRRIAYDTSVGIAAGLGGLAAGCPDLVLGISPPLQGALVAWAIARNRSVPFVLQIKDLVPDIAIALGMLRNRVAIGAARLLERFVYRRANRILVICEGFRQCVRSARIPDERIAVVPDWVDTEFISPAAAGVKFRRAHGLLGRKVVLHSGNMGAKQKLDTVLDAAARLESVPELVICLVGEGSEKSRLQAQAANRRLKNVRFLPLAPRAELPNMLAAADLLLLSQSAAIRDVVAPSKLLTYLAAGRPVIAAASPSSETSRTLVESGGGVVVAPEDPVALAEAIRTLTAHPEQLCEFGRSGRRFAERNFSSKEVLGRLEAELVSCVAGGDGRSISSAAKPAARRAAAAAT
jgi:putative colanic acid biosynthesis glycosyltransferase WcaI